MHPPCPSAQSATLPSTIGTTPGRHRPSCHHSARQLPPGDRSLVQALRTGPSRYRSVPPTACWTSHASVAPELHGMKCPAVGGHESCPVIRQLLATIDLGSVPQADSNEHQFVVANLSDDSPVADTVPPVPGEASGQPLTPNSRILKFTHRIEVRLDAADDAAIKPTHSLVELRGGAQLPTAQTPNSSHSCSAGRLGLPASTQSPTTSSAQKRSSSAPRCSWIASRT